MKQTHISRIDLNLFTVFDAIYTEGSITRAGLRLNLSQSAVSHTLGRLRQSFDDTLFERNGHSMIATPFAHQAIGPVREALQQLETVLHKVRRFDPVVSSKLFAIGVRNYLEPALLPRLMARLERIAPRISVSFVRVERRDLERELSSGSLDMAIDILLPLPENICKQRVNTERLAVVVRKIHPDVGRRLDLDTYLAQRHILISSRRHGMSAEDFELGRLGLQRRVTLRCQHHIAACHVVQRTDLLLTMPERYAKLVNRDIGNRVLPFPVQMPAFESHMYWHRSAHTDPANVWLRERIVETLSQAHKMMDTRSI